MCVITIETIENKSPYLTLQRYYSIFEDGSSGNFPQPVLHVSKGKDEIFMLL